MHMDLQLRMGRTDAFPCFDAFSSINFSLCVTVLFLILLGGGYAGEPHEFEGHTR